MPDEPVTAADIKAAVAEDVVNGIQTFSDGDQSVTMMNPKDRLAVAEKLLGDEIAATNPRFGLRISRMVSPGAWH